MFLQKNRNVLRFMPKTLIPKIYCRFGEMVLEYSTERQPLIKSKETTMSSYTQKQGQKKGQKYFCK